MTLRAPAAALLAAAALAALAPRPARAADLFSPGELTKAHASLEGIASCTKCHPQGQQLSQKACLDCHKELEPRVAGGKGFHGRLPEKERDCWACHHEHQGRDFTMVDWGKGGPKAFDHAKTGVPLKGKHEKADCQKCHDRKLVQDPAVKALLDKQPTRRTYLGAPAACAACHFDEHRGQIGTDCQKCHGEEGFKPSKGFDHQKTAYPLKGKHEKVECQKCHARVEDPVEHAGLQPKARAFARYKPVKHESCLDCHKDPHQGRFGESCTKCHVETDWKLIVTGATEARAFHDKTRYKLEGGHATVKCVACHGPWTGVPAQFREMTFGACTDCHLDAHVGQLRKKELELGRCDRCHAVTGWEGARYGPDDHQKSRYPLDGAHRTVACAACHAAEPRLAERVPEALRDELARRGRPVKTSPALFAVGGDLARCETCHQDPHGGQFDRRAGAKGCTACHELQAFSRTRFDHARDTKFPLEGKHEKAACAACHPAVAAPAGPRGKGATQVKYAGVETTCAGCHADVHAAQFAATPRDATDCARCHGADDWKRIPRFRHEPPFTDWKLTGKHAKVECKGCHAEVRLSAELRSRRYKGVPRACEGCHVDFHKGAFKGYEP